MSDILCSLQVVKGGIDYEVAVVDLSLWCYIEPCKLHGRDCGLEVI